MGHTFFVPSTVTPKDRRAPILVCRVQHVILAIGRASILTLYVGAMKVYLVPCIHFLHER